jgi:predicted transcriptional regulator
MKSRPILKRNLKLRRAILENALSVLELAKACGLTRDVLFRALRGKKLRPSSVRKISAALQRMPEDLGFVPEADVDLDAI